MVMKQQTAPNVWMSLALDTCPNCGKAGLLIEHQEATTAILTCPECSASYWLSPIREQSAGKLQL